MPSIQHTLTAGVVWKYALDENIVTAIVSQQANPAEAYATIDGTTPVVPTDNQEVVGTQLAIPAVVGPPGRTLRSVFSGGQPVPPVVEIISNGTPTILIEW